VLSAFNKKEQETELSKEQLNAITSKAEEVPGGYLFDRSHTWTYLERNGNIRIGLDAFLQKITGQITKIELKPPGQMIEKGETIFILVQNGKRLEIKSPLSGMIMEINQDLEDNASLVNEAPYSEGWIYMIEPVRWENEYQDFFRPRSYLEWIKTEYARLKDFLARIPGTSSKEVILQDGGEIREGLLKEFGPEVWDDFQTIYLKN
jgi:glycine cleavage system H lipoate-binding protein